MHEQIIFCGIIATMLFEDGRVSREERLFLDALMDEFKLDEDAREQVWLYAEREPDLQVDVELLRRAGMTESLLEKLHEAALADGELHPDEAMLIADVELVVRLRLGSQRYPVELSGLNQEPLQTLYALDEKLDEGGFGEIFLARVRGTGQRVAIKKLRAEIRATPQDMAQIEDRFWREVALLGELQSPFTVRLLGAGFDVRSPYMVLEYLEGPTLLEVLQDESPLSVNRTRRIILHALHALSEAHALGIVHRDLKPENIILTGAGSTETARLLDFGLAGLIDELDDGKFLSLTRGGQVLGTLQYMAPEQMTESEIARPQSDVFALGIIALECLTGTPAVPGSTPIERARWLNSDAPLEIPDPVRESRLGPLIERACDKDWSTRYPSAVEMLEALLEEPAATPGFENRPRSNVMSRIWRGFLDRVRTDDDA